MRLWNELMDATGKHARMHGHKNPWTHGRMDARTHGRNWQTPSSQPLSQLFSYIKLEGAWEWGYGNGRGKELNGWVRKQAITEHLCFKIAKNPEWELMYSVIPTSSSFRYTAVDEVGAEIPTLSSQAGSHEPQTPSFNSLLLPSSKQTSVKLPSSKGTHCFFSILEVSVSLALSFSRLAWGSESMEPSPFSVSSCADIVCSIVYGDSQLGYARKLEFPGKVARRIWLVGAHMCEGHGTRLHCRTTSAP